MDIKVYRNMDSKCQKMLDSLLLKIENRQDLFNCAFCSFFNALSLTHLDSRMEDELDTAITLTKYVDDQEAEPAIICYFLSIYMRIIRVSETSLTEIYSKDFIKTAQSINCINNKIEELSLIDDTHLFSELIYNMIKGKRIVACIILAEHLQRLRMPTDLADYKREKAIVSNILIPLSRKLYLGEFEAEALNLMLPISISDSLKPRAENMNQININGFEGKMKKEVPKCMIIVNQVSQSDLHIYCENGNTHVTYAMTILVNHIYECYLTLGVLHECYRPVVEGFKDFIGVPLDTQVRAPKVASRHEDIHWYQAIHSVVSLNQKNQCLVIIQTIEMAAKIRLGSYSDRILQVIDYIPSRFNKVYREYIQSIGIVEEIDNISTDVICCSPGYELFRLPNLSTVLDFAFKIHSDLGLHFGYAIVNGSKVSYNYKIKNGDMIFIFSAAQNLPQKEWLESVRTKKARICLRRWLKAITKEGETIVLHQGVCGKRTEESKALISPTLFISYNWENSDIADSLCQAAEGFLSVRLDKKDLDKGDSIRKFMASIREQDFAVLIISPDYLKSNNCMLEVVELYKDCDLQLFESKVIFYITENAKDIFSLAGRVEYVKYWDDMVNKLQALIETISEENRLPISKELRDMRYISMQIGDFLSHVVSINDCFTTEEVIALVKKRLPETRKSPFN